MNDSPYGLTASVWTDAEGNPESEAAFLKIVDELFTGTVYLNRCVPSPTACWCICLLTVMQVRLPRPGPRMDGREEQWERCQLEQVRCVVSCLDQVYNR